VNVVTTDVSRTLTDWLEELVTAASVDLRMVAIEGSRAGMNERHVVCTLHGLPLKWLTAYRHLADTEAAHRRNLGPAARLHRAGDLVPATAVEDRPAVKWQASTHKPCRQQVIWAVTSTGGKMPVNAEPDPAGDIVLTASTSGGDQALALFLYTESERARVSSATDIYSRHRCTNRSTTRRSRGTS
jgi:hypothetical protein